MKSKTIKYETRKDFFMDNPIKDEVRINKNTIRSN